MKIEIKSKVYGIKYALIDESDYDLVSKFNWFLKLGKIGFYARANTWIDKKNGVLYLHRLVMGNPKGMIVDHINHDTLDCRKENLRICSVQENNMNTIKPRGKKSSKYKGVCLDKRRGRFEAYIHYGNKKIFLGSFKDELDGAKAYDEAALIHFGEFAKLNLIEN